MCVLKRFLILLALTGCAFKVDPDGGPRNTTPPTIASTSPASGTTRMTEDEVTIRFSTYVDRAVTAAVVVQPAVRFRTSFAGDEITVRFAEPLVPNTTYALTVGTSWADARGNKPAQAHTIIFSTGDVIDSGRIGGVVSTQATDNVMVFCHPIDVDSAYAPRSTEAMYRLPIGASGTFRFEGLRDGEYRLLAVRDVNRNGMVDVNEDVGTASADAVVRDGRASDVRIAVAPARDRVAPVPTRARSVHAQGIHVQFSERIDSSVIGSSDVTVRDSVGAVIDVDAVWIPSDKRDIVMVRTMRPMSVGRHTIAITPNVVRDSAGMRMPDTTAPMSFTASAATYTYRAGIAGVSIADSAKRVPTDSKFMVRCTDALRDTTAVSCTLTQADVSVPVQVRMRTPAEIEIAPQAPLSSATWYRLRVGLGNDTTVTRAFQTADRVDPGAFVVTVIDSARISERYLLRVLDERGKVITTRIVRSDVDSLTITDLPPATYHLDVVVDVNGNGLYDAGDVDPWTPGEVVIPLDLKIQVRPRWTIEGLRAAIPTK